MGFKIQSSKFFIVRENYADKEGTVLNSKWLQELTIEELNDICAVWFDLRKDYPRSTSIRRKLGRLFK